MRYILALATVVAATACAEAPQAPALALPGVHDECGYNRRQFVEAWPCVAVGYAQPGNDLRAAYIAKGNYVAEQVREGRMSETEARMFMAEAYQQTVTAYQARLTARRAADAPVDAAIIGGLLQNNRPVYQPPAPLPRQVICYPVGNTVNCN